MERPEANIFFRFVRGATATVEDFLPQGALGKTMRYPGNALAVRAWNEGVSVDDDFEQACVVAAQIHFRAGRYVAAIELPPEHGLEIVQTGKNRHHYTIFADAESLLALVAGDSTRIPGAPRD